MDLHETPLASHYDELHLLPSAPIELAAEVYWQIAGEIRKAGQHDPESLVRVERLNEAYRAIMDGDFAGADAPAPRATNVAPRPRRSLTDRLLRRSDSRDDVVEHIDPGALLRVRADAPRQVVAIAYSYWAKRAGILAEEEGGVRLVQLEAAYRALVPDEPSLPRRAPATASEPSSADETLQPSAERGGPVRAIGGGLGAVMRYASRSSAHAAGGAGRFVRRRWERARPVLVRRLNDPFNEYERQRQRPPEVVVDPVEKARLEERFAELSRDFHHERAEASAPKAATALAQEVYTHDDFEQESVPAFLVQQTGEGAGKRVPIGSETVEIGCQPNSDVVAHSMNGAAVEARLTPWNEQFLLQVLVPDSAILVNGRRVVSVVLSDGDRLQLGDDLYRFALSPAHADHSEGQRA